MATQPHPIYGDVNFGDMFNRGFNFLSDNIIDPVAEAIRQSNARRQGIFTGTANAGGMPPQQQPVLSQPTVNPHPQVQAPTFVDIATPMPRPANLGMLSNPAPANTQPREVNIATPTPRPSLEERQAAAGILSNPANRRDNAILATPKRPDRPDLTIGLNDRLMSIGGRGLRDLNKGSAAALGGMFEQNDLVNEVNRSAALQDYELQMAQMKADEEADLARKKQEDLRKYREEYLEVQRGKKTKTSTLSAKDQQKNEERVQQIDATLFDMARAKEALMQGGVTGFFDGFLMKPIDTLTGSKDEVTRMLLSKLRVDDALLRIAQTKGAISNKEMDLFLSPAPDDMKQENVWIAWIEQREEALRNVRRRLASGDTVSEPATEAQVDKFASVPANAKAGPQQSDIALNPDDQAILDKY